MDLFEKENFLQLVIDSIPVYVFWKDLNSVYLGCNKNFAISAGFKNPEEIIGKTDYDLSWSKEDSDFYRKVDAEVMCSGIPQINFEEPQTIGDQSTRWLRTSKIPLRDESGAVIGMLGMYEDITPKKEMELRLKQQASELKVNNEELRKANIKLEQANIDLEQFSYATSHDLQEPLRMIGGFVGLLNNKNRDKLDEKSKEYIQYVLDGVKRMSSLINGVISYTRLDGSQERFQEVELKALVENKIKDLERVIRLSNAHLEIDLPDQPVYCQPDRIGMLFNNLIGNGIKFNERQPLIRISYEEKADAWLFIVEDNGIGIEADYEEYIFKPFKRLHTRDKYSGNGIGLSICRRIVKIHGGKIWFETKESGGTKFYFTVRKN